jgi:hypothetical protein
MTVVGVLAMVASGCAIALVSFWTGRWMARRTTGGLAGAAQRFCLEQCRLPDGRCPLLRADLRREDCPLWRLVNANLPSDTDVDVAAPFGAGPYRNPHSAPGDSHSR